MPLTRDEQFLDMLGSTFSTNDRNAVGKKFGLQERASIDVVKRLIEKGLVKKVKNGLYQKVQPCENCQICETCGNETENLQDLQKTQDSHSAETEPMEGVGDE